MGGNNRLVAIANHGFRPPAIFPAFTGGDLPPWERAVGPARISRLAAGGGPLADDPGRAG